MTETVIEWLRMGAGAAGVLVIISLIPYIISEIKNAGKR